MKGLAIKVGAVSEIGLRKQENQDRILARVGEGPLEDVGLFVVADGMAGQAGGGEAAETAILICEDWWQRTMPKCLALEEGAVLKNATLSLVEAAHHLNEAVIGLGSRLGSAPGTTFSALFLYGKRYGYVHVGDSRIYKAAGSLQQITRDDTWVSQQVRLGKISAAEAVRHPKKHILTQCAGSGEQIHIHQGIGETGDAEGFILCSDGFYQHLAENEIKRITDFPANTGRMLEQTVAVIHDRGATDNLSAIVITF